MTIQLEPDLLFMIQLLVSETVKSAVLVTGAPRPNAPLKIFVPVKLNPLMSKKFIKTLLPT